ncbi:uncharacterized protein [Aegilops tauschii subsp. strangulata]|uniref:uncharacterized protein n=1 Tax=Aegilops tauschii subsp. strangulata TaxID=200361 RepID=UPI003CC83C9A
MASWEELRGLFITCFAAPVAHAVTALLGGSQALASDRHIKQFFHQMGAAHMQHGAPPGWVAPKADLTFDSRDHPATTAGTGAHPMLWTPTICNVAVTRTLIDGVVSLNVLSMEAFGLLHVPHGRLRPTKHFSGVVDGSTCPLGQICLPITFDTRDNYRTKLIDFNIGRISLPYNAILGYSALAKFMEVTHPGYNLMKMSGSSGILTVAGDTEDALMALKLAFRVLVDEYCGSGSTFTIGAGLPPDQEEALVSFLRANKDVFAWEVADLVGVPRGVIERHLMVCPNARPVKRKARRLARNPVIVSKKGGKERMCVDLTSLNKACPQDPFPLPRIDQIVDSTAECDLLCFLDAFSGYHQIKLALQDVEKMAFLTPCGVYCYTCMLFRLRNAGATFKWLMHIALGQRLGRNIEVYIGDIVVKSREARTLVEDLEDTFASLCKKAIERMSPLQTLKEMQKLAGCVTSLGRFISKLGERALPFLKLMKKKGPFEWTP